MALFTSTYVNRIDKKGRVSVPPAFRAQLDGGDNPYVYLVVDPTLPAVDGNTEAWMEDMKRRVERAAPYSDQRRQNRSLFWDTWTVNIDPEGRTTLPAEVLAHTGITDQVLFAGSGDNFQLWEPETFKAHRAKMRAQIAVNGLDLAPAERTP